MSYKVLNDRKEFGENQICVSSAARASGFKETALILKCDLLKSVIDV